MSSSTRCGGDGDAGADRASLCTGTKYAPLALGVNTSPPLDELISSTPTAPPASAPLPISLPCRAAPSPLCIIRTRPPRIQPSKPQLQRTRKIPVLLLSHGPNSPYHSTTSNTTNSLIICAIILKFSFAKFTLSFHASSLL